MFPIYLNSPFFGQDPAYQYLFAGVDILQGHAPKHNDHPGTPVQVMISAVVFVIWLIGNLVGTFDKGIYEAVVANPETFLLSTAIVTGSATVLATYYLGTRVYKSTGNIVLAITSQLSPILFALTAAYAVYPTPESTLGFVALVLLGVLTPNLIGTPETHERSTIARAVGAGLCCGLGIAVKVTFLPMLGLLIVLRSPRLILVALFVTLAAWFLGVSAIFSRLPIMFEWFYQVLTHSGLHGQGTRNTLNLQTVFTNLRYLWVMFPFLYIAAGISSIFFLTILVSDIFQYLGKKNASLDKSARKNSQLIIKQSLPLLVMVLVLLGQTIMVAKHPGPTYMIPVLPLTIFVTIWLIVTQNQLLKKKAITLTLSLVFLTIVIYQGWAASRGALSLLDSNHTRGQKAEDLITAEIAKYKNPILIGTFNCNLPLCATWFGLLLVPEMDLLMKTVNSDFYHFDIFSRALHVPGAGEMSQQETKQNIKSLIATGRPVLLISPPFEHLNQFKLEKIISTPVQDLYQVSDYE